MAVMNPVLADVGGFFAIAFFVIAFIGWILNIISQAQDQQNRANRQPGGQKKDVQQEIDDFLSKSRRGDSPTERSQSGSRRTDDVEVVERRSPPNRQSAAQRRQRSRKEIWEEQTGKKPANAGSPGRKQQAKSRAPQRQPTPQQPQSVAQRTSPGSANLSQLSQTVEKDLPRQVTSHVQSHLGSFQAESLGALGQKGINETRSHRLAAAETILKMLQSPQGVRQAIILGEVLQRPRFSQDS